MKYPFILLLAFFVVLLGCSDDDDPITKTIEIDGSGTIAFVQNNADCPGIMQGLIQGQGDATPLGSFTIDLKFCTDFVNNDYRVEGAQTYADGDQLFVWAEDHGMDQNGAWSDYVLEGGTGKFKTASGSIRLYGIVDYDNGTYSNYGTGTITY